MVKKSEILIIVLLCINIITTIFCSLPKGEVPDRQKAEIVDLESPILDSLVVSIIDEEGRVSEEWLKCELLMYGLSDWEISRLVKIAKRESKLYPAAYNDTLNKDGSHDAGLFQINSVHKRLWAKYNLFDPKQNVEAAMELYRECGFKPW
jgi:hypothetical protein